MLTLLFMMIEHFAALWSIYLSKEIFSWIVEND